MNTQEKVIAILLGALLAGWLVYSVFDQKKAAEARVQAAAAQAQVSPQPTVAAPVQKPQAAVAPVPEAVSPKASEASHLPEKLLKLTDDEVELTLSSRGAVIKSAKLLAYAENPGTISESNPALTLDFSDAPVLALTGVPGLAADADYEISASNGNEVVFKNAFLTRKITLDGNYRIQIEETFTASAVGAQANTLGLGEIGMGSSKNDILSIDSMLSAGPKPKVLHHGELEPLKSYLTGASGGCSGKKSAAGLPIAASVDVGGAQSWIAVKNRFFVTALASSSETNTGFRATMTRDASKQEYTLKSVAAAAVYPSLPAKRTFTLYVGPKKQALLWDLGMKDVMEFGMWRWVCYPMVWILNLFHSWIPSFGIGIILLTILVRIVFWPLTHKSTVGMRRMQEIQPKIKEIQARCKGNPQKLQQETWQVYRENKVNPMSSCLPMVIQIPVFIALFTVLRAAVELRYASFLWIVDLSEPENLFPTVFPFGGLNILPILMAATMALQSALTPSTGDKQQQKMMMIMMPVMMLVMFYSFPSALSLYWTLSQVISIAQMWWIKKRYTPAPLKDGVVVPDAVEMPVTRQMRRHGNQD